jgi:hypothetical protein
MVRKVLLAQRVHKVQPVQMESMEQTVLMVQLALKVLPEQMVLMVRKVLKVLPVQMESMEQMV